MRVDAQGQLWVQEYEPHWTTGDQRWWVYRKNGDAVAEVRVPSSALPGCGRRFGATCLDRGDFLEIGRDYLLVRQQDEWGVPYVREYRILKRP